MQLRNKALELGGFVRSLDDKHIEDEQGRKYRRRTSTNVLEPQYTHVRRGSPVMEMVSKHHRHTPGKTQIEYIDR